MSSPSVMSPQAGPLTWSAGAVVAATGNASAAVATIRNAISRKCFMSGGPLSGEFEVGRQGGSVCKRQEQDVATRGRRRLPVVDVLSGSGVVTKRRTASRGRLEAVVRRRTARRTAEPEAHDCTEIDNGGAVLRQRPLDRIRPSGLAEVDRRRIVDRLQEAGETVMDDVHRDGRGRRVRGSIGRA